jgi:protease-4
MNPISIILETLVNTLLAIRNLVVRILPSPEFIVLTITGSLPERRLVPSRFLRRRLGLAWTPVPESLEEWRERLRQIAGDPRVRGIVLKTGLLRAGVASLEGLRDALQQFRASRKRVIAFVPTCDLSSYYLLSVADTVVAPESTELLLTGPRAETTFLRAALDRLGIRAEYLHIAEFKTAAHRFLYPKMTEPQREMLDAILQTTYTHLTTAIAGSRELTEAAVEEAIDRGILSGEEARARKLVDVIAFEDELPRLLSSNSRPVRVVPWLQAARRVRVPLRWRSLRRRAIAVVQVVGTIVPGESRELPVPLPVLGQHFAGHETVARALRMAEKASTVKAVVVHVESRGGSAVASDLIWREVERVQRRKPVVVFMGNVAGSGGYYVACGARHIVCSETTLTGSIGVVAGKLSLRGLAEQAGLRQEIVSRGASATMFSSFAEFSDPHWAVLRHWMDDIYARFKARVAAARGKTTEEIEAVARGRVWAGRDAAARGLVDDLGDFETAVRRAKQLAGIPTDADVPVVTIRPPRTASVPADSPAAWVEAWQAAAALMHEHAVLLMSTASASAP